MTPNITPNIAPDPSIQADPKVDPQPTPDSQPVTALATLDKAGAFEAVVTPELNAPLTLQTAGSASISPEAVGSYLTVIVRDTVSGRRVASVSTLITDDDALAGSKDFAIKCGSSGGFSDPVSLVTETSFTADSAPAPALTSAALSAFGVS